MQRVQSPHNVGCETYDLRVSISTCALLIAEQALPIDVCMLRAHRLSRVIFMSEAGCFTLKSQKCRCTKTIVPPPVRQRGSHFEWKKRSNSASSTQLHVANHRRHDVQSNRYHNADTVQVSHPLRPSHTIYAVKEKNERPRECSDKTHNGKSNIMQ